MSKWVFPSLVSGRKKILKNMKHYHEMYCWGVIAFGTLGFGQTGGNVQIMSFQFPV